MSRNVIVGLAVLVVAVLAWIVITRTDDVVETPDAVIAEEGIPAADLDVAEDEETEIVIEGDAEFVEGGAEAEPTVEEAIADTAEAEPANEMPDTAEEAEAAADANGGEDVVAEDAAEAEAVDAEAGTSAPAADTGTDAAATDDESAADGTDADATTGTDGSATNGAAATDDADTTEADATETDTVDPNVEAVDEQTANATEDAIETAAAAETDLDTLLTPEGFNAEDLIVVVDQSDLSDADKASLRTEIENAEDDRDLVPGVIDELRTRLDVE
ncbi:hypothetical protein [uncultured Jannaschia sp.]|uniref:hypothetical protein n=1 Tax=uncultured Jannaschia sp. TaxID=293347 RepID=UPI00263604A0|nr:hypothetical protein [uncultured Jannaschia sp.]